MARLTPEQLEQQIHAVLREQPLRRAPMSLEDRVLGEISRRHALPWWRQSFTYWPTPMRLCFLVLVSGAVALALLWSMQVVGLVSQSAVDNVFQPLVGAGHTLKLAASAVAGLGAAIMPEITTSWLYAALAVIGGAYAVMLGLGATAYRVLWQHR